MATQKKKTLILIDGNALIHRAYHALPPLTTKKGELVNAVYGFAATLLAVLEKFKPDYVAATFDLAAPTFRHKAYADYKATRVRAPDDLYAQIPRVKEVVRAFNIPIYEKEGLEADDVIGTLARQAEKKDAETIIVTGDLDTLQLVTPRTKVFTMRRGLSDTVLYDAEGVVQRYGLTPAQLPDFKGLRGDASDNIPGVKGIGEKTAVMLLQKYDTLEGVYKNISKITPPVRAKLERDKMQAILSKQLGTITRTAPIALDIGACATHDFDRTAIAALFGELNFMSLLKRLPGKGVPRAQNTSESTASCDMVGEDAALSVCRTLTQQQKIAFAMHRSGEKIIGIAYAHTIGHTTYVPFVRAAVREIFENARCRKIGYDTKEIFNICRQEKITINGGVDDILLQAYVLDPGRKLSLETMVLDELGEEIVENATQKKQMSLELASDAEDARRACRRAEYVLRMHAYYGEKIAAVSAMQPKGRTLTDVLEKIDRPLVSIIAKMEQRGVQFNRIVFAGIAETINKKISRLEDAITHLTGASFNINSPQQLADVLFKKLSLPTGDIKKTKTGFSTAASELEKLRATHPIIAKIEDYRELFKLKTTYVDVLPTLTDSADRIHTSFNQTTTATGRLSSSAPNLQNIPIRTDLGKLLRTAFVAPDGYRLVSADYSQIDLRCVAHVSGDKRMIAAFRRGDDIHRMTAAAVNDVAVSAVTESMRRAAKELNFGIIYGMGIFGFARSAGIDRDTAKKFVDAYFKRFPGIAAYMRTTRAFAKEHGYVETLTGRRRTIPEITSPNMQVAQAAERMAINMPIQGLTADIMRYAMIAADHIVEHYGADAHMILQVHDELIFEVREDRCEEFMARIGHTMEHVYALRVPLVVRVRSGENWGEL